VFALSHATINKQHQQHAPNDAKRNATRTEFSQWFQRLLLSAGTGHDDKQTSKPDSVAHPNLSIEFTNKKITVLFSLYISQQMCFMVASFLLLFFVSGFDRAGREVGCSCNQFTP